MANLMQSGLYGYRNDTLYSGHIFSIQLHITVECDQTCTHCYMFDDKYYEAQKNNSMSTPMILALIEDYNRLALANNAKGMIAITGGDPILHKDFWTICEYIYSKENLDFVIMGNPYHIDDEVAIKLKKCGIIQYQMSLDGLEKTHDSIRKNGSFAETIRALETLNKHGIVSTVMMTVSKYNGNQAIPLLDYINSLNCISGFCIDRLVPTGAGEELRSMMFSPKEYREFLFGLFKHERNKQIKVEKKDNLWMPMLKEQGLLNPYEDMGEKQLNGCSICSGSLTILANGSVLLCRRMDIEIGNLRETTLENIYLNNSWKLLCGSRENYVKCKNCDLYSYCRGCPANAYACEQDIFSSDPQCWY